jgi:penicillin-binding protein 2
LEENVINENTSFLSTGGLRIGQWFFPDWKAGGHGITNVRSALANSVNTFFYYIGGGYQDFSGLGLERMVKYEKLFGLDAQTGIDLPGEANGFLPSKDWKLKTKGEAWYIGDTYHVSIGQGDILVTPLQVADYTAVFANGGFLYRPHLIRQVLNSSDQPIAVPDIKPIRSGMVSQKNLEIVRQGMRQTITGGSAQSLQGVSVPVAGKTGTAQWSTTKNNHAWFTGFAPYDKPQIVITILIEQGGEGSSVAVPIAKDVLNWYFDREAKKQ